MTDMALQTCECGSTWWRVEREIQINTVEMKRWPTAPGCEPCAHRSRVVVVCGACGSPKP